MRFTEFKKKVVAHLKTTSATALDKLYNVDRRIIGEWAKVETKINDTTHKACLNLKWF
jgi:hypothetical protein